MSDHPGGPLSAAGKTRREQMLGELLSAMQRRRRTRERCRHALAAAGGAALIIMLAVLWRTWPSAGDGPARDHLVEAPYSAAPDVRETPGAVIRIVRNAVSPAAYRPSAAGHVARIDDQALLEILASVGRPAGLMRIGDRVALSAPVTDAELSRSR